MQNISIFIADDHPTLHLGIKALILRYYPDVKFECFSNFFDLMSRLDQLQPDVLILDISFPGSEGIGSFTSLSNRFPSLKTIIYSQSINEHVKLAYYKAGVYAFVEKISSEQELIKAINECFQDRKYIPSYFLPLLNSSTIKNDDQFTTKEIQIIQLLKRGKRLKEIAEILGLKITTVSTHKSRIYFKLDVENDAEFFETVRKF